VAIVVPKYKNKKSPIKARELGLIKGVARLIIRIATQVLRLCGL